MYVILLMFSLRLLRLIKGISTRFVEFPEICINEYLSLSVPTATTVTRTPIYKNNNFKDKRFLYAAKH